MQIVKGITSIYNGLSEVVEGINPMVSTMENEDNKQIATALLNAGYTVEQIQNFVDVSRVQLDEFLTFEVEIQKRLSASKSKTTATKRALKAK